MSDYATGQDGFIGELGDDLPSRDGESSFKAAKASAKAAADSVKQAAAVALDETRDRVRNLTDETVDRVGRHYGDLEAWVQLKPARALGIAAGVGVLLGLLLRGPTTRVVYLRDR
jgi:ElaB/YqjD/DUF883 family membrane-anchored ribosome-binding protein